MPDHIRLIAAAQFVTSAIAVWYFWPDLNRQRGFFGPIALRVIAIPAIALVIGGVLTGIFKTNPVRSTVMALCYIAIAIWCWKVASSRSRHAPR